MLALPRLGCINLHASLLPRYRGAAPIQWAVAMGEDITGNTTMLLEEGLDTGPILMQQALQIGPDQTAMDLFEVLAAAGAPLVVETLEGLADGTHPAKPQDHARATLAPLLEREDGRMDFAARTATELKNRWRGFQPWPGAFTALEGKKLIVHRMAVASGADADAPARWNPGRLHSRWSNFVACAAEHMDRTDWSCSWKERSGSPAAEFLRGMHLRLRTCGWVERYARRFCSARRRLRDSANRGARDRRTPTICCAGTVNGAACPTPIGNLATALVLGVLRWQIQLD